MINADYIPKAQIKYGPKLGEGGFGVVYKAVWLQTDVAIKQLLVDPSDDVVKDFETEINIHSKLRNPHIVQIFGVLAGTHAIVMEFMSRGSLRSVLEKNPRTEFGWDRRKKIALDISAGLIFLHQKMVIHRDLKSLNVLLDDSYRAKLADFGLAKVKSEITTHLSAKSSVSIKGTTQWMAPEIFESPDYNTKTDVYSFGVVLWELAAHEYPFKTMNPFVVPMRVIQGHRETFPSDTPEAYAQLAISCWDGAPDKRPTIDQANSRLKGMDFGTSDEPQVSTNNNNSPYLPKSNQSITYIPNTSSQSAYLPNTQQGISQQPSFFAQTSSSSTPKPLPLKPGAKSMTSTNNNNSSYLPNSNQSITYIPNTVSSPYLPNTQQVVSQPFPVSSSLQKPSIKSDAPVLFKEINALKGHSAAVLSLIQLADGTLASGSEDRTIKLWDPKKGMLLQTLGKHSASSLAQLSDGTLVSGSQDSTIKLWDRKTGNCSSTLEGHSSGVQALILLSDGTFASGSRDQKIKIWDPNKRKCLKTLKEHSGSVDALIQLPDGTLASGSMDNTIKLWDLKKGKCFKTLQGHSGFVKALKLLSDGTLASGSWDNTIKLWDLKMGNCLQTLQGHSNAVYTLIQLSDGTLVSGSSDHAIKLWDPKTGKCLQTLQGHSGIVFDLIQLADGNLASSGSHDRKFTLANTSLEDYAIKIWSRDFGSLDKKTTSLSPKNNNNSL